MRLKATARERGVSANLLINAALEDYLDRLLPVGFAHGDRYSDDQAVGPERYC